MGEVPLYGIAYGSTHNFQLGSPEPHGGVRGVRPPSIPGCHAPEFAPHLALKLIASGNLTFDERGVLHRVGRACTPTALRGNNVHIHPIFFQSW